MNENEHILSCCGEEGAEIAQDVSKCLRFGLDDRNVLNPTGPTNRERLVDELNDLLGVAKLLVERGIIPPGWEDDDKQITKMEKVRKFIRYANKVGAIINVLLLSALTASAQPPADPSLDPAVRRDVSTNGAAYLLRQSKGVTVEAPAPTIESITASLPILLLTACEL